MRDVEVTDYGSLVLVEGVTGRGAAWLRLHLSPEARRYGNGYAVERRFVEPILDGLSEAGLKVGEREEP